MLSSAFIHNKHVLDRDIFIPLCIFGLTIKQEPISVQITIQPHNFYTFKVLKYDLTLL